MLLTNRGMDDPTKRKEFLKQLVVHSQEEYLENIKELVELDNNPKMNSVEKRNTKGEGLSSLGKPFVMFMNCFTGIYSMKMRRNIDLSFRTYSYENLLKNGIHSFRKFLRKNTSN
jgi:hypothetical protein